MQHAKEEPTRNAQQAEEISDARLGADLLKAALKDTLHSEISELIQRQPSLTPIHI
jgi:hypothetical protein